MGADAVGLGKPAVFSMSAYGEDGIVKMLDILKDELEKCMRLVSTAPPVAVHGRCVPVCWCVLKRVRQVILSLVVPPQKVGAPSLADLNQRLVDAKSLNLHADCAPIPSSPYVWSPPAKLVRSPDFPSAAQSRDKLMEQIATLQAQVRQRDTQPRWYEFASAECVCVDSSPRWTVTNATRCRAASSYSSSCCVPS